MSKQSKKKVNPYAKKQDKTNKIVIIVVAVVIAVAAIALVINKVMPVKLEGTYSTVIGTEGSGYVEFYDYTFDKEGNVKIGSPEGMQSDCTYEIKNGKLVIHHEMLNFYETFDFKKTSQGIMLNDYEYYKVKINKKAE
ncbi:MAG: hypothetical protein MJ121_01455 [Clostridia bacterium]|nr:hypothetical protein [Clostridia bacterium]